MLITSPPIPKSLEKKPMGNELKSLLKEGGVHISKVVNFLKNTPTSHAVSLALVMCACSDSAMPLLSFTCLCVCLHLQVPPLAKCCFIQSCWKGRRVFTKSGSLSVACIQLGPRKLSVIRSSGVSAIQGLLQYWSEWKDSWDFQNCPVYHRCQGCPLTLDLRKWYLITVY